MQPRQGIYSIHTLMYVLQKVHFNMSFHAGSFLSTFKCRQNIKIHCKWNVLRLVSEYFVVLMSTALKKKDRTHRTTTSPVLHPCGGITNVEIARRLVVIRYNCIHFSVLESSFYPSESLTKDALRARNIKFADASMRKGYFYNQRIKTNGSHNLKRTFLLWICHQPSLVSGAVT